MRKLRLAVVGAGRLGGFHAQKIARSSDAELYAVVDPLPESRQRIAAELGCLALDDYRQIYGHVDAAIVATPTAHHFEIAAALLDHGLHLLVEKPLCPTPDQADALVDRARRNHRVLQVGHVERFNPAFTAAQEKVENPQYIEAVRASGFTFRSTDVGAVLDLMIHDIELVLALVRSPVKNVQAIGLSVLGGHEDVANARIEFASGCVAALSASRVSYQPARRMQIWSARGFAAIDFNTRQTSVVTPSQTLLARQFDVDRLTAQEVAYYRDHLLDEHLPRTVHEFPAVDALALELDDFVESIRRRREPRVNGEQARDAVAVAEWILESIDSHRWGDSSDSPIGPLAAPAPQIIPAPHFDLGKYRRKKVG